MTCTVAMKAGESYATVHVQSIACHDAHLACPVIATRSLQLLHTSAKLMA